MRGFCISARYSRQLRARGQSGDVPQQCGLQTTFPKDSHDAPTHEDRHGRPPGEAAAADRQPQRLQRRHDHLQGQDLSKDRISELTQQDTSDGDYLRLILVSVDGLGNEDGSPINGEPALAEVYDGAWSTFLQAGILGAYFEQYGDARVKNSKPSRGR